jgi:RNA polymerase sigma-70 factor (ECF subfamily)
MGAIAMEGGLGPGDRADEVWRAAWTAERQALLAFFRRQVRDREVAEDLLQETFVRAIRAGKLDAGTSLRSYLFTIGQNLVADHWRRRFRVVSRTAEPPSEEEGGLEGLADSRSESPEAAASRRGLERRVREAMQALPDHYRSAFRLAAIEQRSYREIGELLGWSLDQVRINVHRARKRLIAELGDAVAERSPRSREA